MIRKVGALTILVLMAGFLFAQGSKTVTITRKLIDNACADSAKDLDARVPNHSTSCALMESCEQSGYAVYADKKLYRLDDKGNNAAANVLRNTQTKKGVKVTVEGTLDGDTIKVTKLTEVTETGS